MKETSKQKLSRPLGAKLEDIPNVLLCLAIVAFLQPPELFGNVLPVNSESSAEFARIIEIVDEMEEKYGSDHVLFVTDLDNTALVLNTDVGSEHWFLWQKSLLANDPNGRGTVARSFDELLSLQQKLYGLSLALPNDRVIPDQIRSWQSRGIRTMALTSRSTTLRDHSIAELNSIGIRFESKSIQIDRPVAQEFLPYNLSNLADSGLTEDDVAALKLPPATSIILDHGILLTNGQNKGAMLRSLFHRSVDAPKAIVFIDDRPHHVAAVVTAFSLASAPDVAVTAVQYTKSKNIVDSFNGRDKTADIDQWCELAGSMHHMFFTGKSASELPFRVCE